MPVIDLGTLLPKQTAAAAHINTLNQNDQYLESQIGVSGGGYDVSVKAGGTAGVDCDYTSINSALSAGARVIFVKKPTIYEISNVPSFSSPGSIDITLSTDHDFQVGDKIVIEDTDWDAGRSLYFQGLFNITNIPATNQIRIVTAGKGSGYAGSSGGKVKKVLYEQLLLNGNVETIEIIGESRRDCILTYYDTDHIINGSNVENKTFRNIRFIPGYNAQVWNQPVNVKNLLFDECVFWGMFYGADNSPSPTRYMKISSGSEDIEFRYCLFEGQVQGSGNQGDIDFYSCYNIRVLNCIFKRTQYDKSIWCIRIDSTDSVFVLNNQAYEMEYYFMASYNVCNNVEIINNIIVANASVNANAIAFAVGSTSTQRGFIVNSNNISGYKWGIVINGKDSQIIGNNIYGASTKGMWLLNLTYSTIMGNTLTLASSAGSATAIDNSGGASNYNVCDGNVINNYGTGINLANKNSIATSNVIQNYSTAVNSGATDIVANNKV